jgi:hypothetical protein
LLIISTVADTPPEDTRSPQNFFEDTNNSNSLFSDDVEWSQFINNHNSPKPNKNNISDKIHYNSTSTNIPLTNGNKYASPQKTNTRHDEIDSMDYDTGNVDSPMHMTDWLSSAPSSTFPFADSDDHESLFPTFSANLSFSNDHPKDQDLTRTPQKNTNHAIFATPTDFR